jgi:hypothetical protein
MKKWMNFALIMMAAVTLVTCTKTVPLPSNHSTFRFNTLSLDGKNEGFTYIGTALRPVLKITFSEQLNTATVPNGITFASASDAVAYNTTFEDNNTTVVIQPAGELKSFSKYKITATNQLFSTRGQSLETNVIVSIITGLDSTDKFTRITDDALLDLVQKQTFKYFWDFAHPVSGLARERNTSGDVVTTGGSGFGVMALVAAVDRQFITHAEGLAQMQKIVGFLKNSAQKFHGAFPHWLNGETGVVVPFSDKDNGADIVETSFLMQGLLTARQYFNSPSADETTLRNDINALWDGVEWDWFRNGGQDVLYWHWSPDFEFQINHAIQGWNECLITYVLAASSRSHAIPKSVYTKGWAQNGEMKNSGGTFYGVDLPIGPPNGGPLFFSHYSFLGINPHDLQDENANYWTQNVAHTTINYNYCVQNPLHHVGYSSSVWGLTASDDNLGYSVHAPDNDPGVITPTAALSSFPYTPEKSMEAMKFFYYKLGDRIWREYGFVDAFNLDIPWFADSFLAIDQGPIIVMIENYRSGLLWNLFMSCPEVKTGMTDLGFQSPNL